MGDGKNTIEKTGFCLYFRFPPNHHQAGKMKIKLFVAAYAVFCVFSCKKNDQPSNPPEPPVQADIIKAENDRFSKVITSATIGGYVSGIIVAEDEQPLTGVTITCGDKTVVTNSKGFFQFPTTLPLNKDYAVITATLNGYFKGIKTFTPNVSGKANHYFKIKLLKAIDEKTVDAGGGEITLDNKIKLTFPDAAVVTANGALYTGQYKVIGRYIDPSSDNFFETMPGMLAGLNDQNQVQALQSFGMANVEIKDISGNALQIAAGKTVKMELPAIANGPASIPLWHFNEKYGLWIKAGMANKNSDVYTAEVNHFSIWNLDMDRNGFTLNLEFKNLQGNPLPGLHVLAFTQSMNKISSFYTDNEGKATLIKCPVSESLIFKMIFECDTLTKTIAPITENRSEIVTLESNPTTVKICTISGKISGCDNVVLANHPFQLAIQSSKSIPVVTDGQGAFSISTGICDTSGTIALQAYSYIGNEYLFAPAITMTGTAITYNARICDSTASVSDDFVVVFPDPKLNEIIRQTINKPTGDILYRDIKNIDAVTGPKGISYSGTVNNVEGIQFCTNVSVINLRTQNINSLVPFQNLKKLKVLVLYGEAGTDYITDLSPLQNLILLEELYLVQTKLTDLTPVQKLVQLKKLQIVASTLLDITPVKNLPNLDSLILQNCEIADITPLRNVSQIKYIDLADNKISDFSVFASMPNLKELYIYSNPLSDLSPVQTMTKLTGFGTDAKNITDLNLLNNLTNLENLYLENGQLSDISPLQHLTNLKTLQLGNNKITDISVLAILAQLQRLQLEYNNISDLSPLQNLNNLSSLTIDNNNISDISPLTNGVPLMMIIGLTHQKPGAIIQSQKDAFLAKHPNIIYFWD